MRYWILAIALMALVGCSTWGNGKIDSPFGDPYQAGRTFVFIDVVTEPIQPDEMKVAVNAVYQLAKINIGADMADIIIKSEIEAAYPDATPEFRAVMFNMYGALKARLLDQIDLNPELPVPEILSEFNRGINDAVALYKAP